MDTQSKQRIFAVLALVPVAVTILIVILVAPNRKAFDSAVWKAEPAKRYQMVTNLLNEKLLYDLSPSFVTDSLGQPEMIEHPEFEADSMQAFTIREKSTYREMLVVSYSKGRANDFFILLVNK